MKIVFDDTHDLVITHPTDGLDLINDNGKPVTVTIYGSQSDKYKKAKNKALNKRMSKVNRKTTAEQVEADAIELLVGCTKSFNNFDNVDFGNGIIDPKDFASAYADTPWFKDQVDAGIVDNTLFSQPSSTKSEKS